MIEDILANDNLPTLADFASSNVLLGFDFDGTLAPIVPDPKRARMRPVTRRLLSRIARCYPCIVISGRSHDDLTSRLGRLPLWHAFGNHGTEPWAESAESAAVVREWVRRLRTTMQSPGIVVEDKKYSVAIHYRQASNQREARRIIRAAVADLPKVRVVGGDHAFNLMLAGGPTKGVALQRARRVLACETAVYVGDDDTDEDAFASAPAEQLLAIRVGSTRRSRARYRLRAQADIDRLLQRLLTLRSHHSRASRAPRVRREPLRHLQHHR